LLLGNLKGIKGIFHNTRSFLRVIVRLSWIVSDVPIFYISI